MIWKPSSRSLKRLSPIASKCYLGVMFSSTLSRKKSVEKLTTDEEMTSGEEPMIFCFVCGHLRPSKTLVDHIDKCYRRVEAETSYGSEFETKVEGSKRLFCDTYNSTTNRFCKRLKVCSFFPSFHFHHNFRLCAPNTRKSPSPTTMKCAAARSAQMIFTIKKRAKLPLVASPRKPVASISCGRKCTALRSTWR